ncbi:family S53 protease-like protein [Lentinula aff. detonsa]|uniref:tripeptidyl-peptidase II n=1 Tax=Lentinula aff. detonsa TaxID=2804958 RepID=A0AA38NJK0_9AGAR|nr:family S53 protease-like protein [Lentinula aff. detonsa]
MVRFLSYTALPLGLAFSVTSGAPSRRSMAVLDQRELPDYFAHAGTPSPDTLIHLKIALTANNMPGLEKRFWDVSTPGNALYGQHLSFEETKAFASPAPETVSAVTAWLNENGIDNSTTTGAFDDWLSLTIPISTVNSLFDAEYQIYTEIGGPTQLIRTLAYSVPVDLQQHINLIYPSTDFVRNIQGPKLRTSVVPGSSSNNTANARAQQIPFSCKVGITPTCLQNLYGIPTTNATRASNTLGVSGFMKQYPQMADLEMFLTRLRPDIPISTTYTLQSVDGGSDPQSGSKAGNEANLDIQYTVGLATNVPVTFIPVGKDNPDGIGGFLDIMNNINAQRTLPRVLTTSYGFDERDLTRPIAIRLCNTYALSGARGTSVLFASGDGGVCGSRSQICASRFVPTFPSGCPYVTSVGATRLDILKGKETSAEFSGGGFSDYFSRATYQSTSVETYLSTLGDTYGGRFSPNGRAFPDVAAQGFDVLIVNGGQPQLVSGTSCSSPIFASVIALINDRRVSAGKSPLGFLNPFLYLNPGAFFDITTGSNPGCGTHGFSAGVGWDPVTGLGTPNFAALLAAAGV